MHFIQNTAKSEASLKLLNAVLLAVSGVISSGSVHAAAIPWQGEQGFFFASKGSRLADLLRDLGANYGVPVIVSEQIDEPFIGSVPSVKPAEALDRLARMHKLAWYYDGNALYIYKAHEVKSQFITPLHLDARALISQLKKSDILDKHYCTATVIAGANVLKVQGVPVCLKHIETMASRIDDQKSVADRQEEEIRIFPLKYANAADHSYDYRGQQVVVPGIISMLNDLTKQSSLNLQTSQDKTTAQTAGLPIFSVDPQQNAIIVRDKKKVMPVYASLIKDLDKRPRLIEIAVMIVDVNSEDLNSLGIDWSASAKIGGGGVSFNSLEDKTSGTFSSLIPNTGSFMIKLNALQQNSRAQILSQPSVVTLENSQAVLDRSITFHTKLVSRDTAKVESISTGSLLRATPRMIEDNGRSEVMLRLAIQDGRQAGSISEHEPLPQTLSAEVTTQTLLRSGQSLLLGGFVQDEKSEGVRKIPLLGDLPLVGKFFSTSQMNNRSTVRLFLIKAEPVNTPE